MVFVSTPSVMTTCRDTFTIYQQHRASHVIECKYRKYALHNSAVMMDMSNSYVMTCVQLQFFVHDCLDIVDIHNFEHTTNTQLVYYIET